MTTPSRRLFLKLVGALPASAWLSAGCSSSGPRYLTDTERPETRAVRLRVDGAGTAITGVEAILPDGSRTTFTADRYVLAADPVEDVRLLQLSGNGAALGNSSGLVGRNPPGPRCSRPRPASTRR